MAKVTFTSDVQSVSGKLCKREGVIYSVNKQTGKTYRSDRHVKPESNTEAQQEIRATFTTKAKAAAAWWNANKPSTTNPNGTADYLKVLKAYKSQHEIGSCYSYLRTLVQDNGEVAIPGGTTTTTTTTTTPTTPSSDSSSSNTGGNGGDDDEGGASM